ncbi:MAG: hypothetical protein ACREAB_06245 [Blastocatellia bacterium]
MFQDLRFGVRMLLKSPNFTLIAVLTLALGIGAATSLFSVIYGVLISPYPDAKPEGIWTPGLRNAQVNQRMRPYRRTPSSALCHRGSAGGLTAESGCRWARIPAILKRSFRSRD